MAEPMQIRGILQKLDYSGPLPRVLWRTRDEHALLSDVEWDWSPNRSDAYIFAHFDEPDTAMRAYERSATAHANELKTRGEKHLIPVVFDATEKQRRREQREERAATTTIASARAAGVEPTEVYHATARRLGEHDE